MPQWAAIVLGVMYTLCGLMVFSTARQFFRVNREMKKNPHTDSSYKALRDRSRLLAPCMAVSLLVNVIMLMTGSVIAIVVTYVVTGFVWGVTRPLRRALRYKMSDGVWHWDPEERAVFATVVHVPLWPISVTGLFILSMVTGADV